MMKKVWYKVEPSEFFMYNFFSKMVKNTGLQQHSPTSQELQQVYDLLKLVS